MKYINTTAVALLTIFGVAGINAQGPNVRTFFEQLPGLKALPSHSELLQATDQIQHLSKQDAQDLLPVLFADLKHNDEVGLDAALGLYNLALRPDSEDLLKPRLAEIGALLGRSDTRLTATANIVLATMKPRPVEAIPLLASFIMGPAGSPPEKVDSLAVMLDILPTATQAESAALYVLNLPLDPRTRHAALIAAARPGATKKVVDRISIDLADRSETVQIGAIQALALLGRIVVAQHAADLAKVSANASLSATVRRLAQDVLDGKDERCTTLQGVPVKPCQ